MRISDSHSCAVHGAPGIEWLNGSTRGTAPCASIHSPVARCDHVSPSPSTAGEKADDGEQEDGDEREDEARHARVRPLRACGAGGGRQGERHGPEACRRRDKARLTPLSYRPARPAPGYSAQSGYTADDPEQGSRDVRRFRPT